MEVPLDTTLSEIHEIIQAVMGWWDCHLYEFQIGSESYSRPSTEQEIPMGDDITVSLEMLIDQNIKRFRYIYDYGDYWVHEISIGARRIGDADIDYPVYLGGENNCPPEDVGGPNGYAEYITAISDPNHEDHAPMVEWRGEGFDLSYVNEPYIREYLGTIAKRRKLRMGLFYR